MQISESNGIREVRLTTPPQVPFQFELVIHENKLTSDLKIEVNKSSLEIESGTKKVYLLNEREHTSYLYLFGKLATDYKLRLPLNLRESGEKPFATFPYKELLTKNLTPEILYGYGDPAVLRVEDSQSYGADPLYYLLATTNDAPNSFPILRSPDLVNWEFVSFVFPEGQKPAWAADGELISDYWAPELHKVGNEFRVYFVARDKETRELCIGLAKSFSPKGPFIPEAEPILMGNVIDPHVYVMENEDSYLFWKEDNNDVWPKLFLDLLYHRPDLIQQLFEEEEDQITTSFILTLWPWAKDLEPMERFLVTQVFIEAVTSRYMDFYNRLTTLLPAQPESTQQMILAVQQFMKTPLYARQLSADGTALVGERIKVLENDLAWEAHLIEGMWVTKQKGKFFLFYAGNDFSTDQYGIGVAFSDSLLGPYQKIEAPILQTTAEWWAPGHPSVVTGPDGTPQLILHAYFPGKAGYKEFRAVLAVPLKFEGDKVILG